MSDLRSSFVRLPTDVHSFLNLDEAHTLRYSSSSASKSNIGILTNYMNERYVKKFVSG